MVDDLRVAKKLVALNNSATSRGLDFGLTLRTVRQLLTRKTCYYTGKKFSQSNIRTIDRVDNSIGYVEGNVVACTKAVNELKRDLTMREMKMLYVKSFKHQGKL